SIGDQAHVAILLTQIGPEYALIVDAIQSDKDPVNPATIGNRLANTERTVSAKNSPIPPRGAPSVNTVKTSVKKWNYCKKRGHEVSKCWKKNPHLRPQKDGGFKTERSVSGSPRNESYQGQGEKRQGPPASNKRLRINIVRARVTSLYTHAPNPRWILDSAATSHICWDRECFSSFRTHYEMLDTAGDPVEAEGIGTVKLTLKGKFSRALILKNVYYAPRIGMNLISVPKLLRDRYSMVAHPQNVFLQRRGRTIGTAFHREEDLLILRCRVSKRSRPQVQLARSSSNYNHEMDIDEPLESSSVPCAVTTSELNGEARILEEDASIGVDQIPEEALWHARLGHLNRGDLRTVLSQTGTPYRQQTNAELQATPQCPACMSASIFKKTPYEALYGQPPKLTHLRRIGSRAWVLIPKEQRDKIRLRSSECRLLGYCEPNQYKLYEIYSGRVVFSHDVEFDDHDTLANGLSQPVLPKLTGSVRASEPLTPPLLPSGDQREQYSELSDLSNQHNEPIRSEPPPQPINPTVRDARETHDLGYSLYGRKRKPSQRLLESLSKAYAVSPLLASSISIHPHQYIQKILSDFCMEGCQPKSTPMSLKALLNPRPDEGYLDDNAKGCYCSAVGALMYLMVGTRPDIAFVLGTLSRFTSRPQLHHQAELQRFLRYLKATQTYQITYRTGQLIGYTDADFGGSVVTDGAYSTSGYIFQLAGAPISWSSKRQREIATSTTHAEYIGQYNAILYLLWLRTFLAETKLFQ
ncbi:uncharacterized protein N7458_003763, partial [Penicillium daleae]